MEDYDIIDTENKAQKNTSITLECVNEFPSVKNESEQKEITTMIHMKAPRMESQEERKKNLKISAVIDVSGSMNGEKLDLAKESLAFMVQELGDNDEFGVVAFDTNVSIVLPVQKMNEENRKIALYKIGEIHTGGCTNLSGGLFAGIDQIRQGGEGGSNNDYINAILLFTDGQANAGISKTQPLLHELNKKIDKRNDHVIYTFGFGNDHNADLLHKISDMGYGTYSFIQNTSAMKEIFINCLAGLMSVVAQNLKLVITPQTENIQIEKVWTKFHHEKEGNETIVMIKDLFSDEARDILVILKVNKVVNQIDGEVEEDMPLIKYTLVYDNIMTGNSDQVIQIATIKVSEEEYEGKPNVLLDEQRNRMIILEELEKANLEAESGNLERANERINMTRQTINNTISGATAYTTGMVNDLNYIQSAFTDTAAYRSKGSKMYADKMCAHVAQRCNTVLSSSDDESGSDEEEIAIKKSKKVKSTGKMYSNEIQKNMQKKSRQ